MYAISAQVLTTSGDWHGSRQVPTFYLDENVQGITDEDHAVRVAIEIIDPMDALTLDISAVRIS